MSVGIAIITCDRLNMFNECVNSIIKTHKEIYDHLIIVNDGTDDIPASKEYIIIDNDVNLGVGESKSIALKRLMDLDCEHLFLIEDDVKFVSDQTINAYLQLSRVSNIKHLNFCLHGDANKNKNTPAPKIIIDYGDIKMALYHNVTGAMSYYHRSTIKECGYMDVEYRNAMEHVDHTMRLIQKDFHPPFRWFADVENSDKYIQDQDPTLCESKIRNEQEWRDNFIHGVKRFHELYDINVCSPTQAHADKDAVVSFLKRIKNEG